MKIASLLLNAVLIIALLYLGVCVVKLNQRIDKAERQVKMTRALSPGRSKADVLQWMGSPSRIERDSMIGGRKAASILVYRSTAPFSGRLHGNEDVYVVLNTQDQVVTAYYPDYAADRINLEREK